MAKKWIQKAIKRPGRIRRLLGKKEGEKITMADLDRLEARAKGNRSLQAAINLARRFVSGDIRKAAEGAAVTDSAFELIRKGYEELDS